MKSATNVHPSAGHGKGSVRTQNHPLWSAVAVVLPQILVRLEVDILRAPTFPGEARTPRGHNSHVAAAHSRDVAIVLSGGGINGVLLELGFLKRLRESPLWPRIGWIYGTSAGALAGTMAALDRLDDLEEFLMELAAGRRVPTAAALADARRAARLHAAADHRRAARRRRSCSASSSRRPRSSSSSTRPTSATTSTSTTRRTFELAYSVPLDAARDDGPGHSRVRRRQRARAADRRSTT